MRAVIVDVAFDAPISYSRYEAILVKLPTRVAETLTAERVSAGNLKTSHSLEDKT
jgi:hypothetical protein